MKLIIIESPFRAAEPGVHAGHVDYARACLHDSIRRGEAPVAFHLLYTQPGILNDNIPEERQLGIRISHYWHDVADLVCFYTDRGWSPGMLTAYDNVIRIRARFEFRSLSGVTQLPPDLTIRLVPITESRDSDMERIAQIDAMFEGATSWGSWMVEAANEREALANKYGLPHKYQARSSDGGRVS